MRQTTLITALLLAAMLLAMGCAPSPQSLLGRDEAFVRSKLGPPHQRSSVTTGEFPWMGPHPGLAVGERYVVLWIVPIWGDDWWIFLASPSVYERIYHRHPITDKDCVIDVQKYPKGAVF